MTDTPDTLLDGTHAVLTPEYVEFRFVLAGLYSRFLAWLLDALIVAGCTIAVVMALGMAGMAAPGFASAVGFVLYFLVDWGYGIALETIWSGQTVGKRVMGLRVIQQSGVRIGFYHAALRNLARPVDRLPFFYLVGGLTALLSGSHQRLGDMLAGTIVVRERRLKAPSALGGVGGEGLLADPLFVSRVKRSERRGAGAWCSPRRCGARSYGWRPACASSPRSARSCRSCWPWRSRPTSRTRSGRCWWPRPCCPPPVPTGPGARRVRWPRTRSRRTSPRTG